jgi:hypothetical protein
VDQVETLLRALEHASFPHAVAVREANDAELGPVLVADAFDVDAEEVLGVHEHLANVLWAHAFGARTVLPGVLDPSESVAARGEMRADAAWYRPRPRSSGSAP